MISAKLSFTHTTTVAFSYCSQQIRRESTETHSHIGKIMHLKAICAKYMYM